MPTSMYPCPPTCTHAHHPFLITIHSNHHHLQDQQRIAGALGLLRTVVRKFEFKDESQRAPLDTIIQGTFPLLLQIMQVGGVVGDMYAVRGCWLLVGLKLGNRWLCMHG